MSEQENAREWLSLYYPYAREFDFETVVELLAQYKVLAPHRIKAIMARERESKKKADHADLLRLTCQNKTMRGNVYDTLDSALKRAKEIGVRQVEPYRCCVCEKYHVGRK